MEFLWCRPNFFAWLLVVKECEENNLVTVIERDAQSFVNSFLELQTDEAVTREEGCLLSISTTLPEKTD